MTNEQEREAFEAWLASFDPRNPNRPSTTLERNEAWRAWQARAALAAKVPAGWADDQMIRFAWLVLNGWKLDPAPSISDRLDGFRADEGVRGIAAPAPEAVMLVNGMTPLQFALNELYEFQQATRCDTADEYLAEKAAPAQAQPADGYGSVEFGFTFAGIELADGDKRLLALLTNAFGNDHPAFNDMTQLVFAARSGRVTKAKPEAQQPLTQAQRIRLWNNSPQAHGDVVGCDAFERLVKLVESVHRIGASGEAS